MARQKIPYTRYYEQVMEAMTAHGLLLGSYNAAGKANIMTIGWGSVGSVWGVPVWVVLVRPSRYSFQCIEHTGCFTVNVPTEAMGMACVQAGSISGRDKDKFALTKLTAERAAAVLAPVVAECPIVYECQVVHCNDVLPGKMAEDLAGTYVDDDPHRVYFGKIMAAWAEPDADRLLGR